MSYEERNETNCNTKLVELHTALKSAIRSASLLDPTPYPITVLIAPRRAGYNKNWLLFLTRGLGESTIYRKPPSVPGSDICLQFTI